MYAAKLSVVPVNADWIIAGLISIFYCNGKAESSQRFNKFYKGISIAGA